MDIRKASPDNHYIICDSGRETVVIAASEMEAESLYLAEKTDSASADLPLLAAVEIRNCRDSMISNIYSPAIEQLTRWIDSAEDTPDALTHYKTQRTVWHAWADALCELPGQSGWPWPDGDVPWPEQPPKPMRYEAP